MWEKREADLKDSVKKLKETCTEMEQSRMELYTQLKELKASIHCVVPAVQCMQYIGFRRICIKVTNFVSLSHLCRQRMKQLKLSKSQTVRRCQVFRWNCFAQHLLIN